MDTKTEKIKKEIESVETNKCTDGLSFMDRLEHDGHLTHIERLLFFTKDVKKYYYNFTEKHLRELQVNIGALIDDVEEVDGAHYIFDCIDPDDKEDKFKISSVDFAEKIICYEDYHKAIVYDAKKKFYECFYVDMTKKEVERFKKEVTIDNLDELERRVSHMAHEDVEELDDASEGIDALCKFMVRHHGDVTGINIQYDPNKSKRQLHIQITTSKWVDVESDYELSEDD